MRCLALSAPILLIIDFKVQAGDGPPKGEVTKRTFDKSCFVLDFRLSPSNSASGEMVRLPTTSWNRFAYDPAADFRGAALYQSEVVYFIVMPGIDEATKPKVEQWLRARKIAKNIAPEIRLRFGFDDDDDNADVKR